MTHGQLVRRLTSLASQIDTIKQRIEALTGEAGEPKAKKATGKVKRGPGGPRTSYIGQVVNYGGGKVKIVAKTKDGWQGVAQSDVSVNGRTRPKGANITISQAYVYRQLGAASKLKAGKPAEAPQDQPAAEATTVAPEAPVTSAA